MDKIKITASMFVAAMMFGTAVYAEFYNDFKKDFMVVSDMRDGMSFVDFRNEYTSDIIDFERCEDGSFVFSCGEDELRVEANSDTAVFNDQTVKMPAAAYMSGESLRVPARFIFESFGAHVAFADDDPHGPFLYIYGGKDIRPVSGFIGDSHNNWSLNVPDGYYYYPDSVDASISTIDNFEGIKLKIEMYGGDPEDVRPYSERLEDHLRRTELFTGADGRRYILSGAVYSNATDAVRTELNKLMDSFMTEFADGASDVSNISADGTKWEIASFRPGVAFDIPLGWDTYRDWGYWAGYEYGERISVMAEVYADITLEELEKRNRFTYEYFGIEPGAKDLSEFSYGGYEVHMTEHNSTYGPYYDITFFIEDGDNVYRFVISTSASASSFKELPESFREKVWESMYMILDTLQLSDPGNEVSELWLIDGSATPVEYSMGELKLTIPGPLTSIMDIHTDTYDNSIELKFDSNSSSISIYYFPNYGNELWTEEEMSEMAELMEIEEINGIEVWKLNDKYSKGEYENGSYGGLYIFPYNGVIVFLFIDETEIDTLFAKDIEALINSIHR